ncbi:MAG: hypothetical protein MJ211_15135 [Bacteroidales bacterium]|nr:hypothetical protein [Bacteroidales bacterium]
MEQFKITKVNKIYDSIVTIADSFVIKSNKIGGGNGEAKLYIASKNKMYDFFGTQGFELNCFMLKEDLIKYLLNLKKEYYNPSQSYYNINDAIWNERYNKINNLPNVIWFKVEDQNAGGVRGYVNSPDEGYNIIREIALPLVSYLSIMEVNTTQGNAYYWKLFADFDAIADKTQAFVYIYGKKNTNINDNLTEETDNKSDDVITKLRRGQAKFRKQLLEECQFCPFSLITEDRLLIASHIKPYAVCNDEEKYDSKNGFIFSPLYDKLFDQGFITFSNDKRVFLSKWLSQYNWEKIGLKNDDYIQRLPLDEYRIQYLEYHRQFVFKD